MADDNTSSSSRPRRSSFAGDTFANLFGTKRSNSVNKGTSDAVSATAGQPQQYPGPITSAAAQAQRRRLSLTTLGLSGSPNQTSPFNSYRRESSGSAQSGSIDESAVEDDFAASPPQNSFGRRLSFGAKALRDVRNSSSSGGGGGGGGGGSSADQNGRRKPSTTTADSTSTGHPSSRSSNGDAKGREGFNWSENLRTRAERTSIAAVGPSATSPSYQHSRARSVATMEAPVKEIPTKAKEQIRPDHFQERILKGDFYMD